MRNKLALPIPSTVIQSVTICCRKGKFDISRKLLATICKMLKNYEVTETSFLWIVGRTSDTIINKWINGMIIESNQTWCYRCCREWRGFAHFYSLVNHLGLMLGICLLLESMHCFIAGYLSRNLNQKSIKHLNDFSYVNFIAYINTIYT